MFKKNKKEQVEEKQKQTEAAKRREMILSIACGGICLGLSFVLSQITLFKMPQGGSVTPASMLPILFFCLAFGAKKGFVVTFAFSLLQLIGGELVSFPQVMLDYIVRQIAPDSVFTMIVHYIGLIVFGIYFALRILFESNDNIKDKLKTKKKGQ